MNYTEILEQLNKASMFDLHRLQSAIYQELQNPERLDAIKFHLNPGQSISYFDSDLNTLIDAVVIKAKKTRCLVENIHDGKRWNIPFYFINLDAVDTDIRVSKNERGIPKASLKVRDRVGFKDKQQNEIYGEVIRLNQKTATIVVDSSHQWRVAYSLLFPVLDGERIEESTLQELLPRAE